ncbi:hypothetical protein PFICI_13165 [Pestalotiopsis fici W106-1]|uniref:Uncharacterized protein n=1 Tax=Pestalotiopsis fici (strain W106-1 / CGMCC3.15140) TaxID=1229662 RepID=W3WPE0_PESFW|nr:uncharacterized protein PFICI_13165 [Pestalotiopsis fici W106-1]ETS74681.1 hypothetical protein PFICI_13165 [Pestalotiopsis fici W106-1]
MESKTLSPGRMVQNKTSSYTLESLHPDVLVLLLSAVTSLDDLSACIHASPVLYRVFLLYKTSILVRVSYGTLGPAIRDLLILVRTEAQPISSLESKVRNHMIEETVISWKKELSMGENHFPTGITEAEAVHLARVNRTVQYFVELYASIRLAYFERELGLSAGGWSLGIRERYYLSQAFIRCQVLRNLYGPPGRPLFDERLLITRVWTLFESWEMEQISQADSFSYGLCRALVYCEKTEEGVPPTPEYWQAARRALREVAPGGGAVQEYATPRSRYYKDYYPNMHSLRRRIHESTASDPALMDRILQWRDVANGKLTRTPYKFLHYSQQLQAGTSTRPLDFPSVPRNLTTPVSADPPWGWVDAMAGRGADRWGRDLLPQPPNGTKADVWQATERIFEEWRWAGFVFWEKDRAETLKTKGLLGEKIATGWLIAPWE